MIEIKFSIDREEMEKVIKLLEEDSLALDTLILVDNRKGRIK